MRVKIIATILLFIIDMCFLSFLFIETIASAPNPTGFPYELRPLVFLFNILNPAFLLFNSWQDLLIVLPLSALWFYLITCIFTSLKNRKRKL